MIIKSGLPTQSARLYKFNGSFALYYFNDLTVSEKVFRHYMLKINCKWIAEIHIGVVNINANANGMTNKPNKMRCFSK